MKKWDRAAMRFKSAEYVARQRILGVTFQNGDHFMLATEVLLPAPNGAVASRNGGRVASALLPEWAKLRTGPTGDVLEVPAHGTVFEITWDRVRSIVDPEFRAHLTDCAAARARHLGARIRSLRLEAGMTRAALASRLSVPRESIQAWEAGRAAPSLTLLTHIAAAFDVSLREFAEPQPNQA
jgi:DNA-binding XRE family transcriptional regulator